MVGNMLLASLVAVVHTAVVVRLRNLRTQHSRMMPEREGNASFCLGTQLWLGSRCDIQDPRSMGGWWLDASIKTLGTPIGFG